MVDTGTAGSDTVGVLLAQLGTPDAPTARAVRRYLGQFLSDRRVVDLSPWLWRPILHGVVLRTRPRRSAALYRRIWTDAGSPLLLHTRDLATRVGDVLGPPHVVGFGMRYGNPSIAAALDGLVAKGCRRLVVVPLFPQYASATSASVYDAVTRWLRARRDVPALTLARSFPDQPRYVEALRRTVVDAGVSARRDAPLVMSFHGIPQRYADAGDPYPRECERTARALATALGLEDDAWRLVYQSRFGSEPWLQPYADETLEAMARAGLKRVAVITPSFVADCLETLDEMGRENRERFEAAGGERYDLVPCLNATPPGVEAITEIVLAALAGAPCVAGGGCGCEAACTRLIP